MSPAELTAIRAWAVAALDPYVPASRITWRHQDHPREARCFAVLGIISDVEVSTPEARRVDASTRSETQDVLVTAELQVFSRLSETEPDHWQQAIALIDLARRHLRSESIGRPLLADLGLGVAGPATIADISQLVEGGSLYDSRASLTWDYRYRRRYDYAVGDIAGVSGTLTAHNTPDSLTATVSAEP